ncbi:MAG: hypothetical protein MK538_08415 [Planctomycetes bacterium]|nr:hypothetical protein [Planctomycetota bacterium]
MNGAMRRPKIQYHAVQFRALAYLLSVGVVVASIAGGGCQKKQPGDGSSSSGDGGTPSQVSETPDTSKASAQPVDIPELPDGVDFVDGVTGAISGTVTISEAAKGQSAVTSGTYQMGSKPECAALHGHAPQLEMVTVGDGNGLANVFVSIKAAELSGYKFARPSKPAEIDQKGCLYSPHIWGVQTNQDIKLINSDAFLHNVKVNDNRPMNEAMNSVGSVIKKGWFKRPQVPVTFQCEVHPWMRSYACVVEHPCWGVTDGNGKVTIRNVPPGTYTLEFWHEPAPGIKPLKSVSVTVAAGAAASFSAEYN